jgi:hypothetical protein
MLEVGDGLEASVHNCLLLLEAPPLHDRPDVMARESKILKHDAPSELLCEVLWRHVRCAY